MTMLQRGFEAEAKTLRVFGYLDVKAADVAAAHAKWLAGEEMTDVIEMFCESAFNYYPTIFGTRTSHD